MLLGGFLKYQISNVCTWFYPVLFPLGVTSVSQQTETSLCFDLRQLVCKNLLVEGQKKSNNFPNLSTQMPSERAKELEDQTLFAHNHSLVVAEVVSIGQRKRSLLPLCKHMFGGT